MWIATRAKVGSKNGSVEVDLRVMVDPECDLSAVASEVASVVQETATQQMRVALARPPRLQLYYSYGSQAGKARPKPDQAAPSASEKTRTRKARVVTSGGEGETAETPPRKRRLRLLLRRRRNRKRTRTSRRS